MKKGKSLSESKEVSEMTEGDNNLFWDTPKKRWRQANKAESHGAVGGDNPQARAVRIGSAMGSQGSLQTMGELSGQLC